MKIRNLLMITIVLLIGILAVNNYVYAEDTTGEETTEEFKWTDTSKAEITLEKELGRYVNVKISNIEKNNDSEYRFIITNTNKMPELDKEKFESFECLNYYRDKKILVGDCTAYVELNQDLYLWVCESGVIKDSLKNECKYIIEGKKLERIPDSMNVFSNTFLSYNSTQIVFNIPWAKDTTRKINVKIGKITDENILKNIKNNTNDAWNQLLSYAKQSKAIYNEKLTSDPKENAISSYNGNSKIDLSGLIEDKCYYFLYTQFDDENEKYYPVEGLTFALSEVYNNLPEKPWYMFFYGQDKFQWILNEGTGEVPEGKKEDPTTATITKLPNTGVGIAMLSAISVITVIAIIFKFKCKKYRGIK